MKHILIPSFAVLIGFALAVGVGVAPNVQGSTNADPISTPTAGAFRSVEVGVTELSPAGKAGGYAVPASGSSSPGGGGVGAGGGAACELSISPATVDVGDPAPTMTRTIRNGPYDYFNIDRDGTHVYSEGGWHLGNTAVFPLPGGIPSAPGDYRYNGRGSGWQPTGVECDKGVCITVGEHRPMHCVATLTVNPTSPYNITGTGAAPVGTLIAGETLTFKGWVENRGTADVTDTFANGFQIDAHNNGSIDATVQVSASDINHIDIDEVVEVTTVPGGEWENIPNGTHGVRICADWNDDIQESNENNCSSWNTFVVDPNNATLPDLEALSVDVHPEDTLVAGEPTRFRGTVRNSSDNDAGSLFWDSFQYSLTSGTGPWTNFTNKSHPDGLIANTDAFDDAAALTFANPGQVFIRYSVDTGETQNIAESNENNNILVRSFTIGTAGGPAVASCEVSPNPADTGENATWTVNATGGTSPYTYQWSGPGFSSDDTTTTEDTEASITKQYASSGAKAVQVKVTDADDATSGWVSCETLFVDDVRGGAPENVMLDIRKLEEGSWGNSVSIQSGEQVELQWSADNATRCVGDTYFSTGTGSPASGTQQNVSEPFSGERTYRVTCYNGASNNSPSASDTATVNVSSGGEPEIVADPVTVNYGGTSILTWSLNGNNECTISGNNGDTVGANPKTTDASGSTVALYGETTYTLTCPGGVDTITVRVRPQFEEF